MDPELIKLLTGIASSGGGGSVLIVMLIVVGYSIRKGYLSFGNGHCPDSGCKTDIITAVGTIQTSVEALAKESRDDRSALHKEVSELAGYIRGKLQ